MALFISDKKVETSEYFQWFKIPTFSLHTYEVAVAEWLAHWHHMQEVQGSNPGLCRVIPFVAKYFKIWQKFGDQGVSCATSSFIYLDNTLILYDWTSTFFIAIAKVIQIGVNQKRRLLCPLCHYFLFSVREKSNFNRFHKKRH